nr:hypothetical protein [Tanacetum cinerariifolium]
MPCSFTKCLNYIEHKVEEVKFHLFKNRIDLSYANWTRHGEKDEPSISAPKPVSATIVFVDDMNFALDIPTDVPPTIEMVNATKDNFDESYLVKFQELLLDAEKPLYERCPYFIKLSIIVKLFNLKDLRWHAIRRITDDVLRHPADSQAWRTIDEKFLEIAKDPRNLWLGISADGVDVNTGYRHHSVWPVLTVIYNLPPWLCMKRKFIKKNVAESLVGTLLHVSGKTKDGVNARLDLAELGVKPELFADAVFLVYQYNIQKLIRAKSLSIFSNRVERLRIC